MKKVLIYTITVLNGVSLYNVAYNYILTTNAQE